MEHIICDICGSEYAATAERCPICNYARQGTEKVVEAVAADTARAAVKGGRFSSKNVKKRQKAVAAAAAPQKEKNPNRGLWIVVILLLLAIVAVSAYIGLRFFSGWDDIRTMLPSQTTQAPETTAPEVPCTRIIVGTGTIHLEAPGDTLQIQLKLLPENTTDVPVYESSDESVFTVSDTGLITAVGDGQAKLTVTCGALSRTCDVFSWFPVETTAPTVPPETAAPTVPETAAPPETTKATEPRQTESAEQELTLDTTDISFFAMNEGYTLTVMLGSQTLKRGNVTWTTTDANVVTVEKGRLTAVGPGTATITASYEGKEARCIIRCRFNDTSWAASATDVTLKEGESFRLDVVNKSGQRAGDVIWTLDREGVVEVDGRTVTARAPGTVTLTATVDDVTVQCIVRVK